MRHLVPSFVLALAALFPAAASANTHGMTWGSYGHDATTGTDSLSCYGGNGTCDAYHGDMSCFRSLPMLCINVDGSANPGVPTTSTTRWAGANVATTMPILGVELRSQALADLMCADAFGPGWRMAEFHDGDGWGFQAFGHVREDGTRFWVAIDDEPANCWD